MKKIPLSLRSVLSILASVSVLSFAQPSLAGGVSDGGGGTTNPHPADPYWVVEGVSMYGARVLIPYLNAELANYKRSSLQDQASSPFAKLFKSPDKFFEIVKTTPIELHFSTPCLDKNGAPWDGSIYPSTPGAICISPFTMAPKLNEYNVFSESAALMLHELSHLVGTTEDEARAIQQSALGSLSQMDFLDILVAQDVLSKPGTGDISMLLSELKIMNYGLIRDRDLQTVRNELLTLRDHSLVPSLFSSLLVSQERLDQFSPQFLRLEILSSWICSQDAGLSKEERDVCKEDLDKEFAGTSVSKASDIMKRRDGRGISYGPEYDAVQIKLPLNKADAIAELNQLTSFVTIIRNDVVALASISTTIIRK